MKVIVLSLALFLAPVGAANATKFLASPDADSSLEPSADMTAAAMEQALTDLMLGKTAFGATPMGGSVKKIEDLITKDMLPKVIAAHKSDQASLIRLANEIKKCGSTKDGSLKKAQPPKKNYLSYSKNHQKCRNSQAILFTSKENCMTQQRALYKEKVLKCNYFATISNKFGTQKANFAVVKKAGSEKTEQYIQRISATICGKHVHCDKGQCSKKGGWGGGLPNGYLDQYLRAKEACERAKKKYAAKVIECKQKYAAYQKTRGKCNQYQQLMDAASCKHAVMVKDTCEAYAGCYYAKRNDYRLFERKAMAEETDRKAEWRGLKRMECLIKSFADGKVTNAEVDTCKKTSHSTKHLDLKYPKIPPLKKCAVPSLYPATGDYKKREFKPLPTLAKGLTPAPCSGMSDIATKPRSGSPKSAKCSRVSLQGYYSAGALIKCTNGIDARRSLDKNSCPQGTKLFSPRSREDWKTFLASAGPLRAPHWIVDVTRPGRGCGGCTSNPMNSKNKNQKTWKTSDGSPWWLRSTRYNEPNGDYSANCYLDLWHGRPRNENVVSFNDGNCNYHSKSYYCQPVAINLKPKSGSPKSCKCSRIDLAGRYLAGTLVKCEQCLDVRKTSQKNSCPNGMKIFSPASRSDWKTFLNSAGPLRAPHWIIDITRPQNGCGGCKKYSMKSSTPQQATWRTSDKSPWWLRSSLYSEPNGDYHANCFLNVNANPNSPDTLRFNDWNCNYHSRSYYCQPTRNNKNYGGHHRRRRAPAPKPVKKKMTKPCFVEEQAYGHPRRNGVRFNSMPNFANVQNRRNVNRVYAGNTGGTWPGWWQGDDFAGRWTTKWRVDKGGKYRFRLGSDDGSRLYLNNQYILNNDGLHGFRVKETGRTIKAGQLYSIKVEFFERGGHAGIGFDFKGADTKGRWSGDWNYGSMQCPKTPPAGVTPAKGVGFGMDQRTLLKSGWKVWSDKPYSHATQKKDIQPTSGTCVLWGAKRSSGETKFALAAIGRRKKIENKELVEENGLWWYSSTPRGKQSCGFSDVKSIRLSSADTMAGNKRLSWHYQQKYGGYRSGSTTGLNSDGTWRKVVMYGPCKIK